MTQIRSIVGKKVTSGVDPSVIITSDPEEVHDGKWHLRAAGTPVRVLGRYVRERQSLLLMSVIVQASYQNANISSTGITDVLVNGELVAKDSKLINVFIWQEGSSFDFLIWNVFQRVNKIENMPF